MLFAAVGVQVLGSETEETNLQTVLLPRYLQLLGCSCWGARRRRRICGRCCYHAICSCWGAVTMLFAVVGVQLLGSETAETKLLPCYCSCWGARLRRRLCGRCCYTMLFAAVGVQVLGSRRRRRICGRCCYHAIFSCCGAGACWGARRRKRICGRCCYHAICSCWGTGAGERDGGNESADGAVTMLFAAVGVQLLGSETEETNLADGAVTMLFAAVGVQVLGSEPAETNLRTVLLPCYLQPLGCSCWGARLRRRSCYHAICSCWGAAAGERDCGDESADAAVTMLFAAVGVQLLGSETEETNLRTVLLPCYLQLLGCSCWGARLRRRICGRCCYHAICSCWGAGAGERDRGDECCYHAICSCWGAGAGERDCGDESADGAVTMLFAAVGVQLLGSETVETNLRTVLLPCYLQLLECSCRERDCGDESADAAVTMLFAAVGVQLLGSETEEMNLRTLLLPCYLQLLGWRCWGARLRRRICGRCCDHAICSCWGAAAGERDGGDESADGAVTMRSGDVGVEVLGSETAEINLRTVLLPCYLELRSSARRPSCGSMNR